MAQGVMGLVLTRRTRPQVVWLLIPVHPGTVASSLVNGKPPTLISKEEVLKMVFSVSMTVLLVQWIPKWLPPVSVFPEGGPVASWRGSARSHTVWSRLIWNYYLWSMFQSVQGFTFFNVNIYKFKLPSCHIFCCSPFISFGRLYFHFHFLPSPSTFSLMHDRAINLRGEVLRWRIQLYSESWQTEKMLD